MSYLLLYSAGVSTVSHSVTWSYKFVASYSPHTSHFVLRAFRRSRVLYCPYSVLATFCTAHSGSPCLACSSPSVHHTYHTTHASLPQVQEAQAEREAAHKDRNLARKLTPMERRDKKVQKLFQSASEAGTTYVTVYKVNTLANPQYKFKVELNA